MKRVPRRTIHCKKSKRVLKSKVWEVSEVQKPKRPRRPRSQKSKSPRSQTSKSAVVKTISVFYSVLSRYILRCFPINLRSYTISTHLPKPKCRLSYILLNITTQGVGHHSPLTTSLSLPFARWTREGLLTRHSVHTLWIVVPGGLDPFHLPFCLSVLIDTVLW